MTQTLLKTTLEEIEKIKLVCKCGFSAEYPVSTIHGIMDACPVCGKKFPAVSFGEFLKAVVNLKGSSKHFPDCQIQIDTEERK